MSSTRRCSQSHLRRAKAISDGISSCRPFELRFDDRCGPTGMDDGNDTNVCKGDTKSNGWKESIDEPLAPLLEEVVPPELRIGSRSAAFLA
ncbi:hypothetical protein OUZ56_007911 [Daphnia magna]|uniref:Uncharacterized protein n=1 Tax=Daphnia magna TaxID=35525 RepID=A0ABR0ABF0_9CRUS|nr:hypothetical protein OUZ56_007911 [Daphnia magna]